ncbi:MAG: hypothetical protein COA79_18490 [Planctomycetota bacterium]|nr:MAG: hypothetical protein COA79_18490 [Planctomycetota bacterium]
MTRKNILLVAGKKSHGPEGNGIHDYPAFVKTIKVLLDQSNNLKDINVQTVFDDWPEEPSIFDSADTIVFISDGKDSDVCGEPVPFTTTPERFNCIEKQLERGCGFVTFHFSTFFNNQEGEKIQNWNGGYFKWQNEKKEREWYSNITRKNEFIDLPTPSHELSHGLIPFMLQEEYYYNIKFHQDQKGLIPIWNIPTLPDLKDQTGGYVSWGFERKDGGRGFATTCGHDIGKFAIDQFRKMILNGIIWSANIPVPTEGVQSTMISTNLLQPEVIA